MSLSEGHQIIGNTVIEVEQTDSTNVLLAEMDLEGKYPEGTVLFASQQTAGRGQFNRKWESATGENILCSILLKPQNLKISQVFNLNIAITLGVFDTLNKYFPDRVKIKWSNDILVDGKKIAGILIENQIGPNYLRRCVAGIGLNINQAEFGESLPFATSVKIVSGENHDINLWKKELLKKINFYYIRFLQGLSPVDHKKYIKNLYGLNQNKVWVTPSGEFEGMVMGIEMDGRLCIKNKDKSIHIWNPGEIIAKDFHR